MEDVPETGGLPPRQKMPVDPLPLRARPRPVTRLNRRVIALGVLGATGLVVLLVAAGLRPPASRPHRDVPPAASARTTDLPDFLTLGPTSYAQVARQAATPSAAPAAPTAPAAPAAPVEPVQSAPPPPAQTLSQTPPDLPPAVPAVAPTAGAPTAGAPATPAPPPAPPPSWLFAHVEVGPGSATVPATPGAALAPDGRGTALFPPATWAIPADPRQVLYRSHVIRAILLHDIQSDLAGPIRLMVTADVVDKFQSGIVLIPQYAYIHGQQAVGGVQYGQVRLGMTVEGVELPDGTYLVLGQAQAGDQGGASGLVGSVNNHWLQVGVAAVLTAGLSVGSRVPFGSPRGAQPSLSHEFAQDVGSDLNRSGDQIVQRSLRVAPTITIAHGTSVTVQLLENISLQTAPVLTAH